MEEPDDLPADAPISWIAKDMSGACAELEHPADLFLEIRGRDLDELFENALYGFYSQVADLEKVERENVMDLDARGDSLDEALRTLLAEALYRFGTEGFVADAARVTVLTDRASGDVRATARLWGGRPERRPGSPSTEVKAVTYHRLTVAEIAGGGWRATVLFDV
jgi:SHS2 domain-containing protein